MPQVYITDATHDRLKARAEEQGRSIRKQADRDLNEFFDSLLDEKKDDRA